MIFILPPPEAIKPSKLASFNSSKALVNCSTYTKALVAGTSLPSSKTWTLAFLTPSDFACFNIATKWEILECTLPSDNKPMKCKEELWALAFSTTSFQAWDSYIFPDSIDSLTSFAPWE